MKILVDTHCHTIASTHAYSTIHELAMEAKLKNMEMIVITDHGPNIPDSPHEWHFVNLSSIPREYKGIKILRGVEANIIDYEGNLDLSEEILKNLDFVIASLHEPCLAPSDITENTKAAIGALKSPYVDVIGHLGNGRFPVDYKKIILCAKENGKLVEINDHSFVFRKNSFENCTTVAKLCMELGAPIVVSSDAHFCSSVGEFGNAIKVLESINFPERLIMNTTAEKLISYIRKRKNINL